MDESNGTHPHPTPKRIQMSRQVPWRPDNPDAVIVSRGSHYGNPFRIGGWYIERQGLPYPTRFPSKHPDAIKVADAEHSITLYTRYINAQPDFLETVRHMLRGHDLACWCKLDRPCHADVLLTLANLP